MMPQMPVVRTLRLGDAEIARIGLGTNRLTNTTDHVEFVRAAVRAGIGNIDTALIYAGGDSERTIGEALSPFAAGVVVATKGAFKAGQGRPEVLRSHIEESLGRLRTDSIPLYYLHRVDPETPLEESMGVIKEYRDRGAIRHAGMTLVTVDQIERARGVLPLAAVQNPYSVVERTYDGVLDHCGREGIVFVPYFPLRGTDTDAVKAVAARHRATASQIALAWLLRRAPHVLPIPGTLSLEHARENLAALDLDLTDEDFAALS
ncbi:MAG: aldo/keto reductase [Candidatus Dormibacteraeota bacterium]|nr:aldo/keto reductase [Candidatus Dormibacteraeota bacterium]